MNTVNQMYKWNTWQDIDWKLVERQVFKLQKRIYRASKSGDVKLVHKLQRLLEKSYFAKLWATRKVSQDNQGKKTAGIDGKKSISPKERLELSSNLTLSHKSSPTLRVWIPKSNGEKRPLGIPTINERAKQALAKLILEPEWEAKFEPNSFGFRPARSSHDAIEAIFGAIKQKPKYVLDADIEKCFDKINHLKLLDKLNTYPTMRKQVKAWLKSGVVDEEELFPTKEGTPQGGVISPLLANIALHGLENLLKDYARTWKGDKMANSFSITVVRYADDFVIMHKDFNTLINCRNIVEEWLKDMGLRLKPSKTKITHTLKEHDGNHGFNFLGFNVIQRLAGKNNTGKSANGKPLGYKTIISPSKDSIRNHLTTIKNVVRMMNGTSQVDLINKLNPIINGWARYYSTVCSSEAYNKCDHLVHQKIWRWTRRQNPKKSREWTFKHYFKNIKGYKWTFSSKDKTLARYMTMPITRHVKVKANSSLFDGNTLYWARRLSKHPEMPKNKAKLIKIQNGRCNHCNLHFTDKDILEVDHIIPKVLGGLNNYKNLQLLHRHCHQQKSRIDGSR